MKQTLRKVRVEKRDWNGVTNRCSPNIVPDYVGHFHGWGINFEEFEAGPGNYTCGIVEKPDGRIEMVCPELMQFVDALEKDTV